MEGRMIRVLLVEDDPIQLQLATSWIEEARNLVSGHTRAAAAMKQMQRESFDLVVVDWMLPEISGEDLLRWIRARHRRLPVMFATARDEEEEIASILRLGADDYIVKPLRRLEFLARIEALARRTGLGTDETRFALGPYAIDLIARSISLQGKPAANMTPRMAEIAIMLFRRNGELVSRAHLYEHIWGVSEEPNTRTLDTHVSRLRNALELDGRHGWRLAAIYQHGYRLEKTSAE